MKTNTSISNTRLLSLLLLLLTLPATPALSAVMSDYCISPPFVAQSISPNILIVLDNSGSMCGQAYAGSYDTSQFTNGLYYGYFDGATRYKYTNNGRWEVTTDAMNTGTAANPIATGSFLNWATMRRTEVSKKLLIGGKASPRSPSGAITVKLNAQTDCNTSFDKNADTSAGNLIYPFAGDYNFENNDGVLNVTHNGGTNTINTVFPNADIAVPAGWTSPAVGKVNDNNDATYIQNNNTTSPVILGFNYGGTEPGGTITIKVFVRATKSASGATRKIHGMLRIGGTDYEGTASSLTTSYANYSWTWSTNPNTGAAWTWDQIKKLAASGNLNGFGVRADDNYSSSPLVNVAQVYLTVNVTSPNGGPYNIIVDQGTTKATGLIDDLDTEVRFGLGFYNNDNAGHVDTYVGYGSPTNMITSIQNMTPSTWTPLAETLYEMAGYFRQDAPYYSNSPNDYSQGSGTFGTANIFRDPYAYKFTDLDSTLTDMYVPCAKSFILFLTDGESTYDQNIPATLKGYSSGVMPSPNPATARFAGTTVGTTYPSNGTDYMIDVAYWARTADARPGACTSVSTSWNQCLPGTQNIFIYPVFMFGTGSTLLKDVAIYGGFADTNGNNKPDCTTIPSECYKDSNNDGVIKADGSDFPITYYEGNDGYALEQSIRTAISDILKRAASSTAVSVLSSSEGSGANLVQSLFYPKRSFSTADVTWISDLMNYWYYMDPFFKSSQIREDTVRDNSAYTLLDLKTDYITQFYFDATQQKTLAARWQDADGNGTADNPMSTIPIEDTKAIWRAGVNLWWTAPADRIIKTSVDGSTLISFDTTNTNTLDDYLGQTASLPAAKATINYVRGDDCRDDTGAACVCGTANCRDKLCSVSRIPCSTDTDCGGTGGSCVQVRNRTAPLKVCSLSRMTCNSDTDCTGGGGTCAEETHTWKLGDVVSSTPRIMGPSPLNNYHLASPIGYGDLTYKSFIGSNTYKDRQRVFVGSNDGMLHAFRLGKVLQNWTGKTWYQPGRLEGTTGSGGIGTESWAFIPKNVLPYLQHLSQPDYCHIYMVDGPVVLADISMKKPASCTATNYWDCPRVTTMTSPTSNVVDLANTSWRSITIGSMGIGGATNSGVDSACVKTPITVGADPVGWSSYFALDVTEQDNPQLLWEFSNANLGVTNVGPAIVRVSQGKRCTNNNATTCSTNTDCGAGGQCVQTNGKWFAILASGSTGPITAKDFKGTSDKNLRLFVLDLATGALLRTIDTGITNAFAGSLSTGPSDLDKDTPSDPGNYSDDVVYIGYVKDTTSGGVLRLVINDDIDPANWTASPVMENIGPVTTSVANLLDRKNGKLWLYFAEGRYFYKQDDLTTQRKLFGIQEPCFTGHAITPGCGTVALASIKNQTSAPSALTAAQTGWYVNLDVPTSTLSAERVISNPTPNALGSVFFLSFAPNSDICGFGGTTYIWALDYKTGGKVTYLMQGKALVQVSTGAIKELDLSDSSTFSTKDNRRSVGFEGIPPTGQGLMVVTNPPPIKKFMHIQER